MKLIVILVLTSTSVLGESAQDSSSFGIIFGINNNQIGGDGSKPGSCPSVFQPGGSSHSRGKRSPQPQWWGIGGSSGSHYKPNYNNGGGLNWNYPHVVGGSSSYFPGGYHNNHHYNHHNNHHGRPGGIFGYYRGKRSAQNPNSYKPDYNYGGGLNWNNQNNVVGGSSNYPGGNHHHNNHGTPGGSSNYPGDNNHGTPGGSSHSRGKRSPQPQWWSSSSHYKPNYNNGGGLNWNYPNGIGGSSSYPGGHHNNHGHPGGSSHSRGRRSPEYAPYWPTESYKPDYYNQGDFNWNQNKNGVFDWDNNFGYSDNTCYSDSDCLGREKCCNRACTYPIYY